MSNIIVVLDGDHAEVETYSQAYHELPGEDGPTEMVVGGRYLDTVRKRGGEWRIIARRYVMDWNRNMPSTARWDYNFLPA